MEWQRLVAGDWAYCLCRGGNFLTVPEGTVVWWLHTPSRIGAPKGAAIYTCRHKDCRRVYFGMQFRDDDPGALIPPRLAA